MNVYAVLLQPSVLNATIPMWLLLLGIGLACLGAVAFLRWSEFATGMKRVLVAGCVVLSLASARVYASQYMVDGHCTQGNWDALVGSYGYWEAIAIWYVIAGC